MKEQLEKFESTKKEVASILETESFGEELYSKTYEIAKNEYKHFLDAGVIKIESDKEALFEKLKEQNAPADFVLNCVKNIRIQKLREVKQFVADILNAKPLENESLSKFNALVSNDYLNFVNKIALSNEAELLTKLHNLQEELSRLISLKDITSKATIAVGGGFSAGKSQFITSFFADHEIELPIGVQPVTAIASYIVSGSEHIIKGYAKSGGVVDIGIDLYANLSHNFMKELGFNLKTIMPRMAMEMRFSDYEHICFIDTPGYNPSGGGTTAEDFNTAKEYLDNADALIWVAPVTNGVLYQSDLDFLKDLNIGDKKLYVVANKADLRSADDIESVLDAFEDALYDNALDYEGISAYSSQDKEEITFRKKSLNDFINSIRPDFSAKSRIANELNEILSAYKNEIENQMAHNKSIKKAISTLELDIVEDGAEFSDKLAASFESLRKLTSSKVIKEELKELEMLHENMFSALDFLFVEIFGKGLESVPKLPENEEDKTKKGSKKTKQTSAKSDETKFEEVAPKLIDGKEDKIKKGVKKAKQTNAKNDKTESEKNTPKYKYHPTTRQELLALCEDEKINLGEIDTSKITNMNEIFSKSKRLNFAGIETWDVSKVKSMKRMFFGSKFNHDISSWDVSSVSDMSYMFFRSAFNQDISSWDVGNVKDISFMFFVTPFSYDLTKWNVRNVKNMKSAFEKTPLEGKPPSWYK